jgi:hypothetical protein
MQINQKKIAQIGEVLVEQKTIGRDTPIRHLQQGFRIVFKFLLRHT